MSGDNPNLKQYRVIISLTFKLRNCVSNLINSNYYLDIMPYIEPYLCFNE